jgi:hypothetical protein
MSAKKKKRDDENDLVLPTTLPERCKDCNRYAVLKSPCVPRACFKLSRFSSSDTPEK